MITKKANAIWKGDIKNGQGTLSVESGTYKGAYSFASRFKDAEGSTPEELIGAAHAGCFSMALSLELTQAGHAPDVINTEAKVIFDDESLTITDIELTTEAHIPGIDDATFQTIAQGAKEGCPVSKALAGVSISLKANLLS